MARYTTGEVARLCGITVRTVQYYDERGLVAPSELTDGGRRLYSDADVARMRVVCFLKELGFSLKDVKKLLDDPDRDGIIGILADEQLDHLREEVSRDQERIGRLEDLKASLRTLEPLSTKSFEAIATVMDGRRKLRNLRIRATIVGLVMDLCWIGGLLLWIFLGMWWMFAIGMGIAVVLGIVVTRYYLEHTAYICPIDNTVFRPPASKAFFASHTVSTRRLVCPTCHQKASCVEIYAPSSPPRREGKYLVWGAEDAA